MLSAVDIKRLIYQEFGERISLNVINEILNSIDVNTLRNMLKSKYKWEEWHGELINGVDVLNHPNQALREEITQRINQGGKAYKIYKEGRLIIFQYVDPFNGGIIKNVNDVAPRHIDLLVDRELDNELYNMVLSELEKRGLL